MLWQGPVDKNDGKPCETWELTRRSATLLGNIKPCPPGKNWSQDHESKSRWLSPKTRYFLILVLEIFSSFTSVRTPSPVPLSSCFYPISMTWLFWKHAQARKPVQQHSHKSRTPLVHQLILFYFIVSRPGATDPRAKHQALAPSLPISLSLKTMYATDLLTFNASARACGQKRWQTMWNLRTYKAICDTTR